MVGAQKSASTVTNAMTQCLDGKKIKVLWVLDNGEGLSPDHLAPLLGDGQSVKNDATHLGALGRGHITVFPASDLQYTELIQLHSLLL